MKNSNPAPVPDDKKKALQILVPAAAVAAVVVLIGLMVSIGNTPATNTDKGKPGEKPGASGRPTMAGQFNFPLDGPEWKDVGEGLKIWDVKEGTGEPCPAGANVSMYYVGWLTNGDQFDGNIVKGPPLQISLNQVVDGWKQGIPGMKSGGVRRLYIPAPLGYGAQGSPPKIPPNSPIVFEVEMLGFR